MSYLYFWGDMLRKLAGEPPFGGDLLPEPERTHSRLEEYERLKDWTGQDFGLDMDAWRAWMLERPDWVSEPEFDRRLEIVLAKKVLMLAKERGIVLTEEELNERVKSRMGEL